MGIGFAIPVNLINFVVRQLKESGEVKRGWIGVKMQPNSKDIAVSLGLKNNQGVIISAVSENSSASRAGIQPGDIILKFDNHEIDNTKNLSRMVAETAVGKAVPVELWRNNERHNLIVQIEDMPPEKSPVSESPRDTETIDMPLTDNQDNYIRDLEIEVENINAETINRFNLPPNASGVIITSVNSNSDAGNKGLKSGDIITQVDKKPVLDSSDVQNYVKEAVNENRRPVLLLIKDGEQLHFVAVKLKPIMEDKHEPR